MSPTGEEAAPQVEAGVVPLKSTQRRENYRGWGGGFSRSAVNFGQVGATLSPFSLVFFIACFYTHIWSPDALAPGQSPSPSPLHSVSHTASHCGDRSSVPASPCPCSVSGTFLLLPGVPILVLILVLLGIPFPPGVFGNVCVQAFPSLVAVEPCG